MKNLFKNRIVVGLICIIMSLLICFGLTPMFNNALTSVVEVQVVNKEIKKGDMITENMISTVEVGGYNLPSNIIHEADDIVGKYANADLYKGDYVLSSKLSDTPQLKNEYLNKLNGENVAISLSIKFFAGGLSGKLERGDIVTLIASDVGEMRETLAPPELEYVEIIATTTSTGDDNNNQYVNQNDDDDEYELASTITVLATPEQARIIAELEQKSTIHAALVYRGNSENAEKFLDEQNKVLLELYPEESEATDEEEIADPNSTQAQATDATESETVTE